MTFTRITRASKIGLLIAGGMVLQDLPSGQQADDAAIYGFRGCPAKSLISLSRHSVAKDVKRLYRRPFSQSGARSVTFSPMASNCCRPSSR
jgi:hypothetical protein